ncbi:MAG TPA: hypothetical protein VM409_07455 [Chloroflexia bacterium]|nr:hypothetical protein [Chloroflexia bacterium]
MKAIETTAYWAFAGALMGFGIAGAFSIGIPILLIGIFFMSYGLARLDRRGLWAALVGFGAVPDALFLYNYNNPEEYIQLVDNSVPLTLLVPFGIIMTFGVALGLLQAYRHTRVCPADMDNEVR